MATVKAANAFVGRWRITEMELWSREDLDLVVPAFIEFDRQGMGEFRFIAVLGCLDCRFTERAACLPSNFPGRVRTMATLHSVADGRFFAAGSSKVDGFSIGATIHGFSRRRDLSLSDEGAVSMTLAGSSPNPRVTRTVRPHEMNRKTRRD